MELRDWLLFLHLLAAFTWVGGVILLTIVNGRTAQARNPDAVAEIATRTAFVGPRVLFPAGIFTVGFGIWLVLVTDHMEFTQAWIIYALVITLGAFVLFGAYLSPQLKKILAMLEDQAPPPQIVAVASRVGRITQIQTVALASVIAAMVFQWGL